MMSTDKAYEALEDDKGAKDDGKSISAPGLNVGRNDGIQVGLTYDLLLFLLYDRLRNKKPHQNKPSIKSRKTAGLLAFSSLRNIPNNSIRCFIDNFTTINYSRLFFSTCCVVHLILVAIRILSS